MAMTIPTIPDMPAGHIATEADFDALTAACTFLLTKPMARAHDSAGTFAITNTATAVPFNTKDYDTDGIWATGANTRMTIQTPGWYKFRYGICASAVSKTLLHRMQSTAGANNPLGAGVTSATTWPAYEVSTASSVGAAGCSGIWPFYLYALDFLQVLALADSSGITTDTTVAFSFFEVEWVSA